MVHETLGRWLPPRVADLPVLADDLAIYNDGDGGRTNYYSWYRWIGQIVQPRLVCEIGVRLGYSAWSLCCDGLSAEFIGWDNECYLAGSNAQAAELLTRKYARVTIHHHDSQSIESLEPFLAGQQADVFHVDGDHSVHACLHDLELAHGVLRAGGVLIADDSPVGTEPQQACTAFLARHNNYAVLTTCEKLSFRGHHFLTRLS
jgi:cephalosporin hydroxylase